MRSVAMLLAMLLTPPIEGKRGQKSRGRQRRLLAEGEACTALDVCRSGLLCNCEGRRLYEALENTSSVGRRLFGAPAADGAPCVCTRAPSPPMPSPPPPKSPPPSSPPKSPSPPPLPPPRVLTAMGSATDGANGFTELAGAAGVGQLRNEQQ